MTRVIGLKGHKKVLCEEIALDEIANYFEKDVVWVFGDNVGFDKQVLDYAVSHNIPHVVIVSQRYSFDTEHASFIRNRTIVDCCDELIICYDGRLGGEAYFTVMYASNCKKQMTVFDPKKSLSFETRETVNPS
jgi:hypothetical protein